MRKLLIVLGVPIDDLNMDEALNCLDKFIEIGRATGKSHQIATINADFVVNSLHDPELSRILQESDMATADGMPLVWGARWLGVPLEGRVTGADLVPALAERAAERGYSIYFLGARPGVAAQAAQVLQERHPNLKVAGVVSPPNRSVLEMESSIVEDIKAAQPDILLVAFGNPKQEKWISMYRRELQVPVCIGIGGTLDMIAGVTRRAPNWMQKWGLEWLYRLLQEPRRLWKRYVVDLVYFGYFYTHQLWVMRTQSKPASLLPVTPDPIVIEHKVVMNVRGRLDLSNSQIFVHQAQRALAENPFLVLNMAEAEFLDSSALGALVALTNQARDRNGALYLAAIPPAILQVLSITRLDKFFDIYDDVETVLALPPAPPQLFIEPEVDYAGWLVVKMPRTLDATTTPVVLEKCMQNVQRQSRIILDFSETHFLASAGMAAMVKLERLTKERGGELRVASCSRDVLRSLQVVKLDMVIPLFQDVPTAVAK